MRILLQRTTGASVSMEGEAARSIGMGYVLLLGIGKKDTQETCRKMWDKVRKLRLFEDENGKTNLSLDQVQGEILLVSQFTLYANCKKGNRPSFVDAGSPAEANELYEAFAALVRDEGFHCETGWFGEMMNVNLENNGPFTIWLDSEDL